MTAIFLTSIAAGSTVSWVRNGVHRIGVAQRVGVTHATESYLLPPSTPFVEVEMGDNSHLGPMWRADVVASELISVSE